MKEINTNKSKMTGKSQRDFMIIAIILLCFVIAISCFMNKFSGKSEKYSEPVIETLRLENEDNPESAKYLVTDNCISRVYPETEVETFVTNFSEGEVVEVYRDRECTLKVTDGIVVSGMYAKYEKNDRVFEISVLGDINEKISKTESGDVLLGDGVLNQIELTRNIRSCVDDEVWKIDEEVEKKSADVNCNNQIDENAVKTIIDYIVFGDLEIDEVELVQQPEIQIVSGNLNEHSVYTSNVVLDVTEKDENASKTVYKITGDTTQDYRQLVDGEQITLDENGIYKVTVYTYGTLENKSKIEYIIVTINKNAPYTMEYYLEGENGEYTKVEQDTKTIEDGIIGDTVEIEAKQYTGYELDVDNQLGKLQGVVTDDGSLVLKAYYERKSFTYTVTAGANVGSVSIRKSGEESATTGISASVTGKWGQKVTIDATENTEQGYEINWSKWQNTNNESDTLQTKQTELTIGQENKTYEAIATKTIIDYDINYDLKGGSLATGITNKTKYNVETPSFTLSNPSKQGYTFDGWTGTGLQNTSTSVTITSGSIGDREYNANWSPITNTPYIVKHYKETLTTGEFILAETENLGGTTDTTVYATPKAYQGFTYDEGNANEVKSGIVAANESLVLELYYTRNSYSLTTIAGNYVASVSVVGSTQTTSSQTIDFKFEQSVSLSAVKESVAGYTYGNISWNSSDEQAISNSTGLEKAIQMPAEDITLTASAVRTPIVYYITYDSNNGTLPEGIKNPTTYTVESQNLTINNLQDGLIIGHKFAGWTGGVEGDLPTGTTGNSETPTKSLVIQTGSLGDRKYTANWEKDNFNYVVKYHYEDDETVTSEPISAKYMDEISEFEPRGRTGYKLREQPNSIKISNDESQNVLNVYYIKESYTVTLQLDDNVQSVSGSGTYKYGQEVTINAFLKTQAGYTIDWQKWESQTPDLIGNQENQTSTITMPAGDIVLKATSKKNLIDYSIGYNYNNGTPSALGNLTSYNVETNTFTLNNPTKQGYVFDGWTGGTSDVNTGTSGNVTVPTTSLTIEQGSLGDRVYTANWVGDETTKYSIEYYKETLNGTYELAETDNTQTGTTDSEVIAVKKTYPGFEFDSTNGLNKEKGIVLPDGSLVLKLYYKRNLYTLRLIAGDNITRVGYSVTNQHAIAPNSELELSGTDISAQFKYGAQINISAEYSDVTGYTTTWNKWESADADIIVNKTEQNVLIGMPIGNATLTAKANRTINSYGYTIEYYYDGIKDDNKTETGNATYNSQVYNTINNCITGYEEDEENNVNNPLTITELALNNVMKIYYKAIVYRITYNLNDGALPTGLSNPEEYTVNTNTFTLNTPVKLGYTFEGWTGTNGSTPQETITITKGSINNREYVANWIANTDTHYTVEHYKENLDGTYTKVTEDTETKTATTDSNVTAVAKTYDGYTLDTNNENAVPSGKVSADESLVLKLYYKRNMYTLELIAGANVENVKYAISSENSAVIASGTDLTNTDSVVQADFKFGAEVSISATLKTEENYDIKDGIWTSSNSSVSPSSLNTTITMPIGDVTLTASATKTGKTYGYYTKYYYDNELDEEHDVVQTPAVFNTIIDEYTPREKTGYEFKQVSGLPLTITNNIENNVIDVYYEHINYNLTYELNDGTLENNEEGKRSNPETYNVKTDTFTLNNPTKQGYVFLGWTGYNGTTPAETITITKGSTGHRTYTANWRPSEDTQYKVEHYIEKLNSTEEVGEAPIDDNYTLYQTDGANGELIGTTGNVVSGSPLTITGFEYNADKSANTISGTVKPDGTLVLKIYYSRKSYKLKLVAGENINEVSNGGTKSTEEVEKTYKYEQQVAIGAVLSTRDGYTPNWQQWTSSNTDLLGNISTANTSVTIPAGDVTLTASCEMVKASFSYTVEFYYDNQLEITEDGELTEFGSQISAYLREGKDRPGYVYDRSENYPLTITSNPANNVIKFYYELENYNITYDLAGGTLGEASNPSNYNVKSDDITITNPTRENYIFLGWTGGVVDSYGNYDTSLPTGETGNQATYTKALSIKNGSLGNRKYVANWQQLAYKVTVHHYLNGTGTSEQNPYIKVAEDEILTSTDLESSYVTNNLIPTYDEFGNITNEDKDVREYLDGNELKVVNTPANATGTFNVNDIEVIYYYEYKPAVIIVSTTQEANDLVGTEYVKVRDALDAMEDMHLTKTSGETKLRLIRNIKDEAVLVENKNVILDLNGFTLNSKVAETIEVNNVEVKQATIKLDNSKLVVIDETDLKQGKIKSENAIGIYIKPNAEFTLGIEAKPVEYTPEIFGETIGIFKEIDNNNNQGIFNFFDGKITGKVSIDTNSTVDLTPILYEPGSTSTVIGEESYQVLLLKLMENVEARIGRQTYTTIEEAIDAANTLVGIDGSQVEIVLVSDITRDVPVEIDNTKNIKLDIAGKTFTSTSETCAIDNKGKLEIVDSTANSENVYGTGKITKEYGVTIYNSEEDSSELKLTSGVVESIYGNAINNEKGSTQIGKVNESTIKPNIKGGINNKSKFTTYNGVIDGGITSTGTLTSENGVFNGEVTISNGVCLIKDGTFNSRVYTGEYSYNDNIPVVVIQGGNFNYYDRCLINYNAHLTITSGTFNTEVCFEFNASTVISGGTFNNAVTTEDSATTTIENGTFNSTLIFKSSKTNTIENATVNSGYGDAIYCENCTLNIEDGTFNSASAAALSIGSGTVNVYDGDFYSESTVCVYLGNYGTVNLYDGTYETNSGNACILNSASATINIGDNSDEEVSTTKPEIKALNGKGVSNNNGGTFNYYDGVIKSKVDNSIIGGFNEIPEGIDVIISFEGDSNEIEVVTLGVPTAKVAQIGEVTYTKLEDAITAVPADNTKTTIKLLKDIYLFDKVEIPANKNIVLNVNGNNIKSFTTDTAFENKGTLEIKDDYTYSESVNLANKVGADTDFLYEDGKLVSKNHNDYSQSNAYYVIDLSDKRGQYNLTINTDISSEGYDYGFAKVTNSADVPNYDDENNLLFKIADNVSNGSYSTSLKGGRKYYLHFAYIKDSSVSRGTDTFTINSINISNNMSKIYSENNLLIKNTGTLNLKNVDFIQRKGDYNNRTKVVDNTGNLELNGAKIENPDYSTSINNTQNANLTINSGIISSGEGYGVYNNSTQTVIINNVTMNGENCIYNTDGGNVTINNASITGLGSHDDAIVKNINGNVTINGGTYVSGEYHASVVDSANGKVTVTGGNFYSAEDGYSFELSSSSELVIDGNATINSSISSNGTITVKNGTVNTGINVWSGTLNVEGGNLTSIWNYYDSTINITGGTFNTTGTCLDVRNGTVTIDNASITANGYAICNDGANITVLGGTFRSTENRCIYNNSGTITLGVKGDGEVNNSSDSEPNFYGAYYGIDNNGTFNYYDGYIEGSAGNAINGNPAADMESGYTVITRDLENSRQALVLAKTKIAKIESTQEEYYTIQDAINACALIQNSEGETITLIGDIIIGVSDSTIVVPSSPKITLDLNGHNITTANGKAITNNGDLTITNSDSDNNSIIQCVKGDFLETTSSSGVTIDNVTIDTVTAGKSSVLNSGSGNVTITNSTLSGKNGVVNSSSGKIIVNNSTINVNETAVTNTSATGKIQVDSGFLRGNSGSIVNTDGEVIINGGTISSGIYSTDGTVTLNGGTVYGFRGVESSGANGKVYVHNGATVYGVRNDSAYGYGINMLAGELTIDGGTIPAQSHSDSINLGNTTANISDGYFGNQISIDSSSTLYITGGTHYEELYNLGRLEASGVTISSTVKNYGTGIFDDVDITGEVTNSGTMFILNSSVSIENSNGKAISNSGTLTIDDSSVSSTGTNGKGIESTGVLNIGKKDGTIDNSKVTVTGTEYGIYQKGTNYELNIYEGTITGNIAITGNVTKLETNSTIAISGTESEVATVVALDNIVEIGGTGYSSLQQAINTVNGSEPVTIKAVSDFIVTGKDYASISNGQNIIFDLNGHSIRMHGNLFDNKGTLKITDGLSSNGKIYGYSSNLIKNTGTLEINADIDMKYNNILIDNDGGTVKMTGGNISTTGYNKYYDNIVIKNQAANNSTIELSGSDITFTTYKEDYWDSCSDYGIYMYSAQDDLNGTVLMTGGSITSNSTSSEYCIYLKTINSVQNNVAVTISGGAITGDRCIYDNSNEKLEITGGNIVSNYSDGSGRIAVEVTKAEMSGGSITSNTAFGISTNSFKMTGGTITSTNSYAIYTGSGNIEIVDGIVTSTNSTAIYMRSAGTITIGKEQYPVSIIDPQIIGGSYGVYLEDDNATFNFYDGKIIGSANAIVGNVDNTPELYHLSYYNEQTEAILEQEVTFNDVASIGTVNPIKYDSLSGAITAAQSNEVTIKLLKNVVLSEGLVLSSDKKITLDLNGKSLIIPDAQYVFNNKGRLTIIDTSDPGNISKIENKTGIAIHNEGILTIGVDDGTIDTTRPCIVGATYGIQNAGTLNFFDGRIKGKTDALGGGVTTLNIPETPATSLDNSDEEINGDTYKVVSLKDN